MASVIGIVPGRVIREIRISNFLSDASFLFYFLFFFSFFFGDRRRHRRCCCSRRCCCCCCSSLLVLIYRSIYSPRRAARWRIAYFRCPNGRPSSRLRYGGRAGLGWAEPTRPRRPADEERTNSQKYSSVVPSCTEFYWPQCFICFHLNGTNAPVVMRP